MLILPALGIACDILPAFTRKPVFGYRISVWCLVAVGCLSMIVWGHHMFVSGMSPFTRRVLLARDADDHRADDDLRRQHAGEPVGREAAAAACRCCSRSACIALFGSGGFGGLFLGNATADMQLHDTYFVVGHFHMMIGGVTLLATFGAIYFWFPKMFGRMMNETLGKLHFWFTFVPFFIDLLHAALPRPAGRAAPLLRVHGVRLPAEDARPEPGDQHRRDGAASSGQFVFLVNFVWSLFKGRAADANPWQATTLEWTVPSPPPHGNFGRVADRAALGVRVRRANGRRRLRRPDRARADTCR